MGYYFNPITELPQKGRRLSSGSFDQLSGQLKSGKYLIGCYDRLVFKVCPWLKNLNEFNEFEKQLAQGEFISGYYYAVDQETYDKYVK